MGFASCQAPRAVIQRSAGVEESTDLRCFLRLPRLRESGEVGHWKWVAQGVRWPVELPEARLLQPRAPPTTCGRARGRPGAPSRSTFRRQRDQWMKSTPVGGSSLTWMVRLVGCLLPFQFCSETTNDVGLP